MTPETTGRWTTFADRDEWLAARCSVLGSSDVPALVGLGYSGQNAMTVFASKRGKAEQRFTKATRKRFEMGRVGERFVLEMFALETDLAPVHTELPAICYHPTLDFLGSSLDAYVVESGEHCAVECKMVGSRSWMDWADDEPPVRHAVQVQHQLLCTGWQRGFLVGWTGDECKIYEIRREEGLLELLTEKMTRFWHDNVLAGVPPELDGSEATAEALRMLWPRDSGEVVELGHEELALFRRIKAIDKEIKDWKEQQEAAKNRIKLLLGDASYGVLPDGAAVSWKTQQKKGFWTEPSESRPFRKHDRLPKGVASLPVVRPKGKLPSAV